MKNLFSLALVFLMICILFFQKVNASENESIAKDSQIIIAKKYAEKFCSAKEDNFFEGLDKEKTLKYSYFKYIGLQSKEIYSKDMYQILINQIREKCLITKDEEKEINEFLQQVVE